MARRLPEMATGRLSAHFIVPRKSAASTKCILSARKKSVKGLLKAIMAGALLWVAINLVAIGYQPAQAGSVVATVEIVLALVVAILACVILRWM
jgi:hypothetical protein